MLLLFQPSSSLFRLPAPISFPFWSTYLHVQSSALSFFPVSFSFAAYFFLSVPVFSLLLINYPLRLIHFRVPLQFCFTLGTDDHHAKQESRLVGSYVAPACSYVPDVALT